MLASYNFMDWDGDRDLDLLVQTYSRHGATPCNDFDLPYGWSEQEPVFDSILDRTLLRPGETIHMKHVYRAPTPTGLRSGGTLSGTLVLQHRGSPTSFELPLALDDGGIGENEWTPPKGAPAGDYDIRVKLRDPKPGSGGDEEADEGDHLHRAVVPGEIQAATMRASVSGPRARR